MESRSTIRGVSQALAHLVEARCKRPATSFKQLSHYSSRSENSSRLNVDVNYETTPLLHHTSKACLQDTELAHTVRSSKTERMNLFRAVNSALRSSLGSDERVLVFGEDVAFGGVFRCTLDLAVDFGGQRVFNTPLSEQGIVGFAIGAAAQGLKPIAEIQFGDYVWPSFDQLVNEAAKFRYREGKTGFHVGGMVVRMPVGAVGHGALYHTQSPESLFTHIPGLRVVMPRGPFQAKGLLLSAVQSQDPVLFLEPKFLYRAAVEEVPLEAYTLPLSKADVVKVGANITVISYGAPLYLCSQALAAAEADLGISVELIDLRTLYPWDRETVMRSVAKTGRAIIVHESMVNAGVGAEISAAIQETEFLHLEAPVRRVAGWSTHSGLVYEQFNLPDVCRIYESIKQTAEY